MKNSKKILMSALTGVAASGLIAAPALAWHPQVNITKYVTNQSAGGQMADANDAASAVSAKPGDLIKYTMVVENPAAAAQNSYNDLYFTTMTDQLPAGVELVSDSSKRQVTEDLGVLKPGQKVTKEYTLKVTSTKDGDVIVNEACVKGDSKVKDAPRSDCDKAVIKVSVPPVVPPKTPEPPVTPPTTPTPPAELPHTGVGNLLPIAGVASAVGYVGNLLRIKRNKR